MRRPAVITEDDGVATVMVALSIPFILLFCVLAIDVSNWFVHKRHLQTQADAAALAGAGAYRFPSCDDNLITNMALRYSGKGDAVATYNPPDDVKTPQTRLHAVINGPQYFAQAPGMADDTDLAGSPSPCTAKLVDVKMTENNVPLFFDVHAVEPTIYARARVKLFQVNQAEGVLPLGVQEAAPRRVRAYIVDEATGTEIASKELDPHGSSAGLQQFDNDSAPLSFTVPSGTSRLGVRLALSGTPATATCLQPLVSCYDTGGTNGLSFIRTWTDQPSTLASPAAPVDRSVYLTPGTCTNGSFNSSAASCNMGVGARVSWNGDVAADPGTMSAKTELRVIYNGNTYPMTYASATDSWTAPSVPVPAGTIGPRNVDIEWEQHVGKVGGDACKASNNKTSNCIGTFRSVQRTFWNNPDDQSSRGGPIAKLDVLDSSTLQQVSDLQRCSATHTACTANLIFEVGIKGSLSLDQPTDPPRSLRVAGSGSQNQTLDCDPARNFVDEIAYGCQPPYKINQGTACSAPTSPLSCVPVQTGTAANKPAQGFNVRFLCAPSGNPGGCKGSPGNWDGKPSSCPPAGAFGHNNWPNYPTGDPRLVSVFLVPFGTFESSGNQLVPIIDFGAFYVTAWSSTGGGFANPCIGNGDQFVPGTSGDNGVVSGHFVKKVDPNTTGSSTDTCDFNDIGQCVAVLVK